METQASLVVPKDAGELEMFVSTQNANKTQVSNVVAIVMVSHAYLVQLLAAMALGIPAHQVLTRVKRIGMV